MRDEGRPLGAGLQGEAPTPLKLGRLRTSVVSIKEKAQQRLCQVSEMADSPIVCEKLNPHHKA
jgi:hypothetical protein